MMWPSGCVISAKSRALGWRCRRRAMSSAPASPLHRIDRSVVVAIATFAIVVATSVVSIFAFYFGLPPDDAAFGKDQLAFPVGMVAIPLSVLAFAVAWPLMHFGLKAADLRLALPVVAGTVLVVTPLVALVQPVLAPVLGLASGAAAILLCRRAFRQ